jgi:RimJ/RimL family protein N-acetyltransferase
MDTDRLVLRRLEADDAGFILELLNDPAWLRFIGDRGVRSLDDARDYITNGPVAMYDRLGFGLYLVERKDDGVPIGICGLIKRDALDNVDLGFAFLPEYRARGYAYESASAAIAYAREALGLGRIAAITTPDNQASTRLLEKLGFHFERTIQLSPDGPDVSLFATDRDL